MTGMKIPAYAIIMHTYSVWNNMYIISLASTTKLCDR